MKTTARLLLLPVLAGWACAMTGPSLAGSPQISPPQYEFAPAFGDSEAAEIYVKAPGGHCSDVRYRIFNTKGKLIARSGWLSAGESDTIEIEDRASNAVISIGAEGREGGCNSGSLDSWGVEYGQK